MTGPLILSTFPGIDLLGRAFEEEWPEACIVRGPDRLWGGDIKRFHPPAGKFDGVIGGPPCQAFSRLRHLVEHNGYTVAENLIPEFERCVAEAQPEWFLMENVPASPTPWVEGYAVARHDVLDVAVGGETSRRRAFCFGWRVAAFERAPRLEIEWLALHRTDPEPTVCASDGGRSVPVKIGGSGKRKRMGAALMTDRSSRTFEAACGLQGLPRDFLVDAPFTYKGKRAVIGAGVPMKMGRAIARAVKGRTGDAMTCSRCADPMRITPLGSYALRGARGVGQMRSPYGRRRVGESRTGAMRWN